MDRKERIATIARLGEIAAKVYNMGHHQNCAMSGDSGSFCDCGYEIAARICEDPEYGTAADLADGDDNS